MWPEGGGFSEQSDVMTSPPARDPRAQITCMLVLSLRYLTEPSLIKRFAPPGWKLLRLNIPGFRTVSTATLETLQLGIFGIGGKSMVPML
jgi:hypothetical protein